ncbi:alpha/beta hydrolase [Rhodococcus sp. NPDC056743]|uniref:alpha/beta hydrolase n=1 Tax=Rhodococcus sp. NPDC056743 TaxID=3345934 RepID=UPI0036717981
MTLQHRPQHWEDHRSEDQHLTVMVLPGGKVSSHRRSRIWHLSNLRMRPFSVALQQRGFDVTPIRYRTRGWNDAEQSPVADARHVLDRIKAQHPDAKVILLGHSMGGRVAAALSGDAAVVGIVALAPWWPAGTEIGPREGFLLRVVHGTADRWTDPDISKAVVERARRSGLDAEWIGVEGAGHFMLRRASLWHRLAADAVSEIAADSEIAASSTEVKAGERR